MMISISDLAQIITALTASATFILALLSFVILHLKINVVAHQTNSLKDELVNEVRLAAVAQGRLLAKEETIHAKS